MPSAAIHTAIFVTHQISQVGAKTLVQNTTKQNPEIVAVSERLHGIM